MRYNWKNLNSQQIGTFAEYFVKMELTMHGFQVYTTEVDDRGIDFVTRYETQPFVSVQVKSILRANYVFLRKDKFALSKDMILALVLFQEGSEPGLYFIPSSVWKSPNALFVSRDYIGKKSAPEWGLNISQKNMPLLEQYSFDRMMEKLKTT